MKYVGSEYWRNLHSRQDLSAVGQSGLPPDLNNWIYRTIGRNLRRFAQTHGIGQGASRRMLEVGVGTGYWIDMWQELGWHVDGCDLVDDAVERLRSARPRGRFWQADVSSEEGILSVSGGLAQDGYDLVTATSVLLHVTRPRDFKQALVNVADAVRPGGFLLLVEPALLIRKKQPPFDRRKHSRMRILRSYVEPLREQGLELVTVRPTTVLAANPLEAHTKRRLAVYRWWWRQLGRARRRPWLVRIVGPLMFLADQLLMKTGEAPTSKILLFRRSRPSASAGRGEAH